MSFRYSKSWSNSIISEMKNFFNVSIAPPDKELNWTTKKTHDWIDVATSGSVKNGEKINVGISRNVEQLPVGEHKGTVTFSVSDSGKTSSQTVEVDLSVEN
jgi:hypothetical protein